MVDDRGWRGGDTARGPQLPPTPSAVLDVYEHRVLVSWVREGRPLPVQARAELLRLGVREVGPATRLRGGAAAPVRASDLSRCAQGPHTLGHGRAGERGAAPPA